MMDPPSREHTAGAGGWQSQALVLGFGLLAAAGLGYIAATRPDLFHVDVASTPLVAALVAAGAVGVFVLIRSPRLALVLLVGAVYLNLSDVLVRQGLPSLLQLMALPVLLAGIALYSPRELIRVLGQPLSWLLAGYVLVLLFSTTYAQDVGLAQSRFVDTAKAFVLYLLVLLLATSKQRVRLAAWTLLLAALVLSVLATFQVVIGDFAGDFGGLARFRRGETYGGAFGYRVAGPLGDPNFFAQILVPAVPIGLFLGWHEDHPRRKLWAFGAVGWVIVATLFTYSRGGALALGLVLALSLLAHGMSWRRLALGGAALLLAGALFMPSGFVQRLTTVRQLVFNEEVLEMDSSFEERLVLMRTAGEMFVRNPVFGVGAANYPTRYGEYVVHVGSAARDYEEPGATRYPHNLYLEMGAETGLVGLGLFLATVLYLLVALDRGRRASLAADDPEMAAFARSLQIALLGYLASSLFLHGHFQRYLWLLFGLAAASMASVQRLPWSPMARSSGASGPG